MESMAEFVLVLFIIVLIVHPSQSLSKEVTLTPQNTAQSGASVTDTGVQDEVSIIDEKWHITTIGHDTWHLVTHLDNSWGFDLNEESNITFEIDGVMSDNLIFAFTTSTLQKYIAIRVRPDYEPRMVPYSDGICPVNIAGVQPNVNGDIETVLGQPSCTKRLCDFGGFNSADNTDLLVIIQGGSTPKAFPVKFTLTNRPITLDGSLTFRFESAGASGTHYIKYCVFQSFDANQGLQIYFAVDDSDICVVNSLKITYSVDSTYVPTSATVPSNNPAQVATLPPTKSPTSNPTETPSVSPTQTTTVPPIQSPTKHPTETPSVSPTQPPLQKLANSTRYPSVHPTKYPAADPTLSSANATQYPSTDPIQSFSNSAPSTSWTDVDISTTASLLSSTQFRTKKDNMFWIIMVILVLIVLCLISICCALIICSLSKQKPWNESSVTAPGTAKSHLRLLRVLSMSHDNDMDNTDNISTIKQDHVEPKNVDVNALNEREGPKETNTNPNIGFDEFIISGDDEIELESHVQSNKCTTDGDHQTKTQHHKHSAGEHSVGEHSASEYDNDNVDLNINDEPEMDGVTAAGDYQPLSEERQKLEAWFRNTVQLPYYSVFVEHGFEELSTVSLVTMDVLKEMGINKIGHRLKVMQYINCLNEKGTLQ